MPVQGCGGLRASLASFVKEEKLSGDNRYYSVRVRARVRVRELTLTPTLT